MSSSEFVCEKCLRKYKTRSPYEKHLSVHEAESTGIAKKGSTLDTDSHSCKYCGKQYKTLRGLNKHELLHIQAGTGAVPTSSGDNINPICDEEPDDSDLWPETAEVEETAWCTEEITSFFEEEDEEQEAMLLSATFGIPVPISTAETQATPAPTVVQKEKNKSDQRAKTPTALCSVCGKGYLTLEGYIKHRIAHATEDVLARAPSFDEVMREAGRIAGEVLKDILKTNENATSKLEKQLNVCASQLQEHLHSDGFVTFLTSLCVGFYACFAQGTKFLLPSHLREAYLRGAAILLANNEKKEELQVKILAIIKSEEIGNDTKFFLTTFMRKFSLKLLAFIVHWMIHGKDSVIVKCESLYIKTKQSLDSIELKQTLHFTAGANVKSVLRNAWRKWSHKDGGEAVIRTLRDNFLIGGPNAAPNKEFMKWTLCQDRGKLIKINEQAFSFFLELATVVKPLEHFDGSLYLDEVIQKISTYPKIIYLWEELVSTLPKQLQFQLLHSLCACFCNTWRSGILSRRMDDLNTSKDAPFLGTGGVAFRTKVVKFNQ